MLRRCVHTALSTHSRSFRCFSSNNTNETIIPNDVHSILETMIQTRRAGKRLVDAQERELYRIYRKSRRGVNLNKLDQAICDLFQMVKDNHDVSNLTKLSDRLEQREWYGLACRVQDIIARQDENDITAWRRLAALAIQNRDYDTAKLALERAQQQLTQQLLDQAEQQENTEAAIPLFEQAVYITADMDRIEVLFRYAQRLPPDAALVKLNEARTTLSGLAKAIVESRGVVPSHSVSKVNELPVWKDRIEAKIKELEGVVSSSEKGV